MAVVCTKGMRGKTTVKKGNIGRRAVCSGKREAEPAAESQAVQTSVFLCWPPAARGGKSHFPWMCAFGPREPIPQPTRVSYGVPVSLAHRETGRRDLLPLSDPPQRPSPSLSLAPHKSQPCSPSRLLSLHRLMARSGLGIPVQGALFTRPPQISNTERDLDPLAAIEEENILSTQHLASSSAVSQAPNILTSQYPNIPISQYPCLPASPVRASSSEARVAPSHFGGFASGEMDSLITFPDFKPPSGFEPEQIEPASANARHCQRPDRHMQYRPAPRPPKHMRLIRVLAPGGDVNLSDIARRTLAVSVPESQEAPRYCFSRRRSARRDAGGPVQIIYHLDSSAVSETGGMHNIIDAL
ncbi:hypothetical protein OIDMADRAFT_24212 [Oidiodendron maius Zn]|uniref:Uncharacterized protein n=1 Tax=Oidiodendron maius (strain Zn) TaxID=913774 RepID=A0A0C3HUB6_OIDMZ|nr:hypothetical protein OIDMADRAFT_24212 [Oidiodendron maius Zn]